MAPAENVFVISAGHPALAGHFVGNPVVPGVVVLTEVLAAVRRCYGAGIAVTGLRGVKFTSILRPEETARIAFVPGRPNVIGFTCKTGQATIAAGSVQLAPARSVVA